MAAFCGMAEHEDQKDTYIAWLNDAHAMEEGLVVVLEKQLKETVDEPDLHTRLEQHLVETKRHAELVEGCITRLGSSVSGSKDFMAKLNSNIAAVGASFMGDALVKEVHSSYAAEHFEIATYTLLRAAASMLGDPDTAAVCSEILVEEEAMADWLIDWLPRAVERQLTV